MKQSSLSDIFLNQTKALYWVVDLDYRLIYANKSYLSLIKEITGSEKKLNDTVFVEGFGEGYIEKWKTYYNRAIKGEHFEVEEHFYNAESGEIEYGQVTFEPLVDDSKEIFAVACLSKDITELVNKKSEATQLMDASLDVFCTVNDSGNFVYVSAASKDLWGYEPKELVGTPYAALVFEEDLPDTKAIATAVMNGEETKSFINRYKKKDGSIAYNLWSARWDEHTKLMYCTARDGKEKIEQEKEVLQSEQRFKALVQEGSDLIGILDIDGNYSYVSPTSSSVLGISPEEFIGRNAFDFIHPDDAERVLVNLQKIATENKVTVEPFRFQNHKNEWRWIESILINMLDNPVINGIVANSRDVTEKIEEKHHLKLLESVITNTSDAVLITEAEPQDEPGPKILYVNEAFTKMTGYSAEEVIGKTPRILQGPKSNNVELAKLGKALRNWESYECTTINYKKNGEEFWINFKVTPVKNEKGWYTQWIAIERDVTEQKQKELEKELLGKISLNFSTENDLASSTKALCETICGFGTFDFVELWLPGFDDQEIKLMASTYSSEQAIAFQEESREVRAFARGQGLQGIVWNTKSTLLWEKSSKKDDFIRKEAAKKAGINSALGIPLFYNDNVVGVLTVATHLGLPFLKKYVQLFEQLEHFIGSEINRKRLENDLSHLYDAIPDIVSVGDFRGRFLRINKAGYDLLGYTEEEILYQGFEKFIHPDDLDAAISEMARIQTGESNFGFELRFLTKSGEVLWLSWYCKANVEEGLIYCTAKNITEEKKLRTLNKQASNLAKIGSWEYDLIQDDLFWSDEVHRLHETDPNTFVPNIDRAIEFYKEEHKPYVADVIQKALSQGVYLDYEAIIVSKSKKERWIRVIGSPEYLEGRCVKFIGSYQDITDRKEADLALLKSEAKFRTIFDIATLGIAQVDPLTGKIALANAYYETITGYTPDELLKMSFVEFTHPDDKEKDWELFSKAAHGEGEYRNEKRYIKKDGTIVWVRLHVAFIRDGKGNPTKTVAICEDITDRKEAESRLKKLSDNIPGVVFQYFIYPDGTDEFKYVSKGAEKIWSYSPEAVIKDLDLVWDQVKAGGDFEAVKQSIIDSIENKSQWSMRYRIVRPDGEKRIIQGLGTPEFLPDGTVLYNTVALDITQESINQELLDDVVKLTKIGSWEVNLINNTVVWTDQVHEIYETNPNTFEPEIDAAINFYREDYRHLAQSSFEQCKVTGDPYDIEAIIVTANKKERWVRTTAKAEIVDGVCTRVYGSFQDIHERKKVEAENKFRANLLSMIGQATVASDLEGRVNYWNEAAEKIYGWKKEEALGKKIINLTPIADNKEEVNQIMDTIRKGETWIGEFQVKKKDGTIFPISLSNSPIYNENGKLSGTIGVSSDISTEVKNKKLLEQYTHELERSNEELEQFAFIASHDLQEPLRMVTGFMDQLNRKYGGQLDEKAHQYIHFATDGAKRMKQIIFDLLEYSRSTRHDEKKQKVNFNDVIAEFKQLRRKLISEKMASINANDLPTIPSYKAAITQVFHCLLDNALKYAKSNTAVKIKIKAEEKKSEWEFSIEDNGIGIDPKFHDKIFVIFQRLHNNDEYSGTGIGLAIAKKHVEYLGGKIWIESALEKGSTFYFTIPKNKEA